MATIFNKVELNSINFINKSERRGTARSLFWPWAAANVSFLALSYGSFFLGFGISFWQATAAAIIASRKAQQRTNHDIIPRSIWG
jgi:purine-cytosine permease-like protein